MRRDKKRPLPEFVPQTTEIPNLVIIRQAAESTRSFWKYRQQTITRERDAVCLNLLERLRSSGIPARVVTGFYSGPRSAGFHVWVEGNDFLVDAAADAVGSAEPIYIGSKEEARKFYVAD